VLATSIFSQPTGNLVDVARNVPGKLRRIWFGLALFSIVLASARQSGRNAYAFTCVDFKNPPANASALPSGWLFAPLKTLIPRPAAAATPLQALSRPRCCCDGGPISARQRACHAIQGRRTWSRPAKICWASSDDLPLGIHLVEKAAARGNPTLPKGEFLAQNVSPLPRKSRVQRCQSFPIPASAGCSTRPTHQDDRRLPVAVIGQAFSLCCRSPTPRGRLLNADWTLRDPRLNELRELVNGLRQPTTRSKCVPPPLPLCFSHKRAMDVDLKLAQPRSAGIDHQSLAGHTHDTPRARKRNRPCYHAGGQALS